MPSPPRGKGSQERQKDHRRAQLFEVLDHARVHTCGLIRSQLAVWQQRGLYVIYQLKKEWLRPEDYLTDDDLAYAVNRCLANMGIEMGVRFSLFNPN